MAEQQDENEWGKQDWRREQDWGGYRRLILTQLQVLQVDLASVRADIQNFRQKEISDIKVEIALLKLRSSMWGAILGALGGGIISLVVGVVSHLVHW